MPCWPVCRLDQSSRFAPRSRLPEITVGAATIITVDKHSKIISQPCEGSANNHRSIIYLPGKSIYFQLAKTLQVAHVLPFFRGGVKGNYVF
jgi:hypothetical protein